MNTKKIMRPVCIIFFCAVLVSCTIKKNTTVFSEPTVYHNIDSLISQKDFFKSREFFNRDSATLTEYHALMVKASLHNAFNKPAQSNAAINKLFEFYGAQLTDSVKLNLLRIRSGNHARLFDYSGAATALSVLLHDYPLLISGAEITDFQNSLETWQALAARPAQTVTRNGTVRMKMQRDKVGLKNIHIKRDTLSMPFVLDTGANFSTVNETTAAKMGMVIVDSAIDVGAITGKLVEARLGICPEFSIGSIVVKNAVFLVFPDASLYFPQVDYQLNGIIGFPVIEALGEIQLTHEDELIVPENPTVYKNQNMTLDFLTPIIQLGTEYYTFDTGAANTMLYPKYYNAHPEAYSGLKLREFQSGSVGGIVKRSGYLVTFNTMINNKKVTVDNVDLYAEDTNPQSAVFYGNLGQDLFSNFKKITINFRQMFIKFD
ncbi:MAG: retropepsin-like aspartic protease [Bacteroidia bacterium]